MSWLGSTASVLNATCLNPAAGLQIRFDPSRQVHMIMSRLLQTRYAVKVTLITDRRIATAPTTGTSSPSARHVLIQWNLWSVWLLLQFDLCCGVRIRTSSAAVLCRYVALWASANGSLPYQRKETRKLKLWWTHLLESFADRSVSTC